ncbi:MULTISPECIES: trypsin-like serine protease [Thiorhodovibrio]|uniref:trypsin-like serine protease n=1 Tax=Thiorhodovibrio TaxID=61593 RepID=UPI001913B48A|nr:MULTISPECIES: trypsin-like serine protease [Thiorhodovibrio]
MSCKRLNGTLSQARQVLMGLCAIRDPRRRRPIAALVLLLAAAPACALHQGKVDIGGQYPAVVKIATEADGSLCSATKISAHWLLTAAHCLVEPQSGELREAFKPGGEILLSNTPVQRSADDAHPVVIDKAHLAPAYARGLQAFQAYKRDRLAAARERELDASAMPTLSPEAALEKRLRLRYHFAARYPDVALLRLRTATPDIPTLAVEPKVPDADTEVTLVGYGCAAPGADSTHPMRRVWGTTRVIRADAINFYTMGGQMREGAPSLCPGNSGGPVLHKGRVIGVNTVVYGLNARHGARSNMAVNLAPLADWLEMAR